VTQLEALRVIANAGFKPKNTIEFHFYAGEEGGLLGSQAVFANYASTGKTVLAVVVQDMTGYSPSGKVSVYTDYSDSKLVAYVRKIVTQYTGLTYTTDTCGYGCSDHASAYSNGFRESRSQTINLQTFTYTKIAASYVCDEVIKTSSPYIHTPNDVGGPILSIVYKC
jgi:leucyl aminopeptidase